MSNSTAHPGAADAARGALAASLCYLLWGLVPLYWRQLADIQPLELIAHRHVWSLALVFPLALVQGQGRELAEVFLDRRTAGRALLSAALLTGNWLVYVWGVNTGRVIETSLGYFLVPLVNVALGRFVLGEHLRRAQWMAVGLAAAGVLLMILRVGHPPWIALSLAGTWGAYSLMRKQSRLGALVGLTVETLVLAPLALGLLAWRFHTGEGALGQLGPGRTLVLMSSGLITAIPLLMFAYAARRIRLSTLGVLQYLAPTVQFALGYWHYRERLEPGRVLGFAFIWAGLVVYTLDNLLAARGPGPGSGPGPVPPTTTAPGPTPPPPPAPRRRAAC